MFGFADNGASNVTAFTEVYVAYLSLFCSSLMRTISVTAVLVSRFLLNLQEANKVAIRGMTSMDQLSTLAEGRTISFARFMGSIGESIGPGVSDISSRTEDTDDTLKAESFELLP